MGEPPFVSKEQHRVDVFHLLDGNERHHTHDTTQERPNVNPCHLCVINILMELYIYLVTFVGHLRKQTRPYSSTIISSALCNSSPPRRHDVDDGLQLVKGTCMATIRESPREPQRCMRGSLLLSVR
jgi:hypothetical protein